MYFNVIAILVLLCILGFIIYKNVNPWEVYVGYLNPAEALRYNIRLGEMSKNNLFYYPGGVVDLKKHPELTRFHVIGEKDVLVRTKPFDLEDTNFTMIEGKTKIAIFEIIEESGTTYAIPCIRTFERLFYVDTNYPLPNTKSAFYLASYNGVEKKFSRIPKENLIGIVEYESV